MYHVIKKTEIGYTEKDLYNPGQSRSALPLKNASKIDVTQRCHLYDLRAPTGDRIHAFRFFKTSYNGDEVTYDYLLQNAENDLTYMTRNIRTKFYRCVRLKSLDDLIDSGTVTPMQTQLGEHGTFTYGAYILIDTDRNIFTKSVILMEDQNTTADADIALDELTEMLQNIHNRCHGAVWSQNLDPMVIDNHFNPKMVNNDDITRTKMQDFIDSTARVQERAQQKQAEQMPFRPTMNPINQKSVIDQIGADFRDKLNNRATAPAATMVSNNESVNDTQEEYGMILLGGTDDDMDMPANVARELMSYSGR